MTKEEILHLARLARIKMSDEEVLTMQNEIQSILEYVGQVNEIVADAELTKTAGPLRNVWRADRVTNEPGAHTADLVTAFPDRAGRYLKVKKILNPDT